MASTGNQQSSGRRCPIWKQWVNGPKVKVIHEIDDPRVPDGVREAEKDNVAQGGGAAEGFYYQGRVFLIASRLSSPKDVLRVFFHEALGHHGLRGAFGQALNGILLRTRWVPALRRTSSRITRHFIPVLGLWSVWRIVPSSTAK